MPLVVDVSAIAPLVFPDEDGKYTDAVLTELSKTKGIVPGIFWYELWNLLATNITRRNRISMEQATAFLNLVDSLKLNVAPLAKPQGIFDLTAKYGLSAYDAAYLDIALRTEVELATLDKKLAKATLDVGATLFEIA